MKTLKILVILVVFSGLISAVRLGDDFALVQVFPFMGGYRPDKYDVGGIAMLLITLWGFARLKKNRKRAAESKAKAQRDFHDQYRQQQFYIQKRQRY